MRRLSLFRPSSASLRFDHLSLLPCHPTPVAFKPPLFNTLRIAPQAQRARRLLMLVGRNLPLDRRLLRRHFAPPCPTRPISPICFRLASSLSQPYMDRLLASAVVHFSTRARRRSPDPYPNRPNRPPVRGLESNFLFCAASSKALMQIAPWHRLTAQSSSSRLASRVRRALSGRSRSLLSAKPRSRRLCDSFLASLRFSLRWAAAAGLVVT